MLVQAMAAKLDITTGKDRAHHCQAACSILALERYGFRPLEAVMTGVARAWSGAMLRAPVPRTPA